MRGFSRSHKRHVIGVSTLAVGLVAVSSFALSASASASAGALTPLLDCVSSDPTTGDITAYYGYSNTTGAAINIAIGENNEVFPASPFEGQPTSFGVGDYPRVFSVTFDPNLFPSVAWILDGQEVDAHQGLPACAGGVTTPPDGVGTTKATLTGVVVPEGTGTTYRFEWGVAASLGKTTALTNAAADGPPLLAQAALTGLAPAKKYYYRLDVTGSFGSGQGSIRSFTTAAVPVAPALALTTTTLPAGKAAKSYSVKLSATGGTGTHRWSITKGALPAGLRLNATTGVISGTPKSKSTAAVTIAVTDALKPYPTIVSRGFKIQIAKAH
jgi:hypothetical protein